MRGFWTRGQRELEVKRSVDSFIDGNISRIAILFPRIGEDEQLRGRGRTCARRAGSHAGCSGGNFSCGECRGGKQRRGEIAHRRAR